MASPDEPRRRPPLPARLLGIGARAGERVASATGIDDAVEGATEEAIVRALESPAVERAIVRVLESEAAQDAFERTLSSPAVERAAVRVLDSELVDHVWDRLLASDEAQKLIERIAEAPELRAAIASQGVGLVRDIGRQVRDFAMRIDDGLERIVRRLIGRPRRERTDHVGLITRSVAMLLDGAILNVIFLGTAALLGLVASALGDPSGVSTAGIVFGVGAWILFGSLYLLTFWATAGQTPGMRLISIRIEDYDGSPRLGIRRARRRLFGLILALIPFGLGLLGVLSHDDRRGWWDRRAGTDVVPADPLAPYSSRAGAAQ
ncbi:MAG TPA: RDD family protein [Solirubrobacterales bacterium]|nr:RDD family protein [Solirubrobacterales bacterium]